MKHTILAAALLFFSFSLFAQQTVHDSVYSKVTTAAAKAAYYKYLVDTTIILYLQDPLTDTTDGEWNEAFWSMELLQYKDDFTKQKLAVAWKQAAQLSDEFQKN
jgi:hypothetical protein